MPVVRNGLCRFHLDVMERPSDYRGGSSLQQ
jgi:hypothetical protein